MTARKPKRAKGLGLTDEQYHERLAAQGGGCAICGAQPKTRRLDCDHDHATMDLRGLLSHRCNRALPTWITADWLRAAACYLDDGPRPDGVPWLTWIRLGGRA